MGTLRFLGVHGLGDHRNAPWKEEWEATVRREFPDIEGLELEFKFLSYDEVFEKVDLSFWETTKAVYKLLRSGVDSIFGGRIDGRGGARGISDALRWYAGYVVAWVEDDEFKKKTRALVHDALQEHEPDVLLAHSLGTLVTFDALTHASAAGHAAQLGKLNYVTFGSQIGNAFVRGNLTPGRIVMPPVRAWRHLYNDEDDVFTAPIRMPDEPRFRQIDTFFDIEGVADHSATEYLGHRATRVSLWEPFAEEYSAVPGKGMGKGKSRGAPLFKAFLAAPAASVPKKARKRTRSQRRALLVGINEYPKEPDRLAGCVNDVFLMSEALQECGFAAKDIRIVLDQRATARGIVERLDWLVDDARADDEMFFYYSGHGAQLPTYGEGDQVDRMDETLVPWDFDWSPQTCVTDDRIFDLYSQLPYAARLFMMFDCCHSGGIHRAGAPRARGLNPPDDIRHRALKWDPKTQTWEQRKLTQLAPEFSDDKKVSQRYFGKNLRTARIGRAAVLRTMSKRKYQATAAKATGPVGPYLPLILEACAEEELAYEYRHGATSYGAFTYTLVSALRRRKKVSFQDLVAEAAGIIKDTLGFDQHPQILGPTKVMNARVPWMQS